MRVDLNDWQKKITGPWSPVEVGRADGQVMNLALFEGSYHWHSHDAAELFYVHVGRISIGIRGQADLLLNTGEFAVVPAGTEHCPRSDRPSYVLMIEPIGMKTFKCEE